MASFTDVDLVNANRFADQWLAIHKHNAALARAAHLVSHLEPRFERADPQRHYYYPPALRDRALLFSYAPLKERICLRCSCDAFDPTRRRPCVRHQEAL